MVGAAHLHVTPGSDILPCILPPPLVAKRRRAAGTERQYSVAQHTPTQRHRLTDVVWNGPSPPFIQVLNETVGPSRMETLSENMSLTSSVASVLPAESVTFVWVLDRVATVRAVYAGGACRGLAQKSTRLVLPRSSLVREYVAGGSVEVDMLEDANMAAGLGAATRGAEF